MKEFSYVAASLLHSFSIYHPLQELAATAAAQQRLIRETATAAVDAANGSVLTSPPLLCRRWRTTVQTKVVKVRDRRGVRYGDDKKGPPCEEVRTLRNGKGVKVRGYTTWNTLAKVDPKALSLRLSARAPAPVHVMMNDAVHWHWERNDLAPGDRRFFGQHHHRQRFRRQHRQHGIGKHKSVRAGGRQPVSKPYAKNWGQISGRREFG